MRSQTTRTVSDCLSDPILQRKITNNFIKSGKIWLKQKTAEYLQSTKYPHFAPETL
jgi:hypothetical protein